MKTLDEILSFPDLRVKDVRARFSLILCATYETNLRIYLSVGNQ